MTRPHCQSVDACAAKSATTHCKRCAAAALMRDPAIRARHKASIEAKFADPDKRAAHIEVATHNIRQFLDRPGTIEFLRERAEVIRPLSRLPEAVARRESRMKAAAEKRTRKLLPWCPPDRLEQYRHLTRVKHLKPAEARAIIEDEIQRASPEAEARRIIARITAEMEAKEARRRADAY